ncbi:hypothetical protein D7V97_43265, partial [Corallococcus sp. CA053C]
MRTILNFDDGLGAGAELARAPVARPNVVRGSSGLFQSHLDDAVAEGVWGRWGGAVIAATVLHGA